MTFASSCACYLHAYALFSLDYEGRYNVHGLQMYMLQARSAPKQAPMCVPSFKPCAVVLWVDCFRRLIDGNSNVREEIVALKMCSNAVFTHNFCLPPLICFFTCFREVFLTFVSAGLSMLFEIMVTYHSYDMQISGAFITMYAMYMPYRITNWPFRQFPIDTAMAKYVYVTLASQK